MDRTEIDGVPVIWQHGPPPLAASLVFGVGARDETFRTIGVTHLIEHLAMCRLPKVHHDRNASVTLETTDFVAGGRPEQIVSFLRDVCLALTDLPMDRLATEAGVLTAEGGNCVHPTAAALLGRRFGAVGPGLAPWAGPGYDRIEPAAVRAHAARFFTAGNAVLTLTGPPPDGLALPLPAGPRAVHEAPQPLPSDLGPRWSPDCVPSVGLALSGSRDRGWSMATWVLADRLTDRARHERGLSYDVDLTVSLVDSERLEYAVIADARDGQEAAVAGILWDEVRRLAADGPTEAELRHQLDGVREQWDDPRSVHGELDYHARCHLFGLPAYDSDQQLERFERVTPAHVSALLTQALPSTLITVPEEVQLDLEGVNEGGCTRGRERPAGTVYRPPVRARMFNRAARRSSLVRTSDGVALVDDDGDVHSVAFDEVVGVMMDGGNRIVFGRAGCLVPVIPELYPGIADVIRDIDRLVPAELRYEASALRGH